MPVQTRTTHYQAAVNRKRLPKISAMETIFQMIVEHLSILWKMKK